MKKSKFLVLGLIALLLASGCGESSNEDENDSSSTEQPKGGYSDRGTQHKPAENCKGKCMEDYVNGRDVVQGAARNTYRLNNEHIAHAEYAYDDGALASWYENGGDIHNAERFTINGVEFSVNIDGKPQIPCFSAQDIAAGDAAGRAQAAECRKEMDKYLGY